MRLVRPNPAPAGAALRGGPSIDRSRGPAHPDLTSPRASGAMAQRPRRSRPADDFALDIGPGFWRVRSTDAAPPQSGNRPPLPALAVALLGLMAPFLLPAPPAEAATPTKLTLSPKYIRVAEDVGTVDVTATLDHPAPAGGTAVTLKPFGGYERAISGLPFAFDIEEGERSATYSISVTDDSIYDGGKLFYLTASATNPTIPAYSSAFAI